MAGTGSAGGTFSRLWHLRETIPKVIAIARAKPKLARRLNKSDVENADAYAEVEEYASAMKTALFADFFSILALVGFVVPFAWIIDGLITVYVYYRLGKVGIWAGSVYLIELIPGLDALPMFTMLVLDHYETHGAGSLGMSSASGGTASGTTGSGNQAGAGLTGDAQDISFYQIILILSILVLIIATFMGIIPGGTFGMIVTLVLAAIMLFLVTGIMGTGNFTFTFNKLILAVTAIGLILVTFFGLIPGGPIGNIVVIMFGIFMLLWVFGVIGGPGDSYLKILVIMLISFVVLAIVFGMISPSAGNLPGEAILKGGEAYAEVVEEAPTLWAKMKRLPGDASDGFWRYWEKQKAIATGDYYQGQVDKYADKELGVFLKDVEAAEKSFYLESKDVPIQVFANIEGVSLEVDDCEEYLTKNELEFHLTEQLQLSAEERKEYLKNQLYETQEECENMQNVSITCGVNNKKIYGVIKPTKLDLFDIQGGSNMIECILPPDKFRKETSEIVDIKVKFPFVTKSYLKTYFMDISRLRDMKRQKLDPLVHYKITDKKPSAVYTGGPIMLGIGIKDELPLTVNTQNKEQRTFRLGITLDNKWQGKIVEMIDLEIILPNNLEFTCPGFFAQDINDQNKYLLIEQAKKQVSSRGIKDVKTYNCRIQTKDAQTARDLLNNIPLVTKHIKVTAKYKYELEESAAIRLKSGDGIKDSLEDCHTPCTDYDGCYCDVDNCPGPGAASAAAITNIYVTPIEVARGKNCNGEYKEITEKPVVSGDVAKTKDTTDSTKINAAGVNDLTEAKTETEMYALIKQTYPIVGIDVSHWNSNIDWVKVKTDGIHFAWIKSTQGISYSSSYIDYFKTNIAAAKSAGIHVGAYHFADPVNQGAEDEANYFVQVAGSYMGSGYLRPVVDIEENSRTAADPKSLGKEALSVWVDTFIKTVKSKTGIEPIIYANREDAKYLDSRITNNYNYWLATYVHSDYACITKQEYTLSQCANPSTWSRWDFWQYRSNGNVDGISGNVDMNVFRGNGAEFNSFLI